MINQITRFIGRTGLVLKKYSPQILTGIGLVGLTAAGVIACVQTTKADKVIESHKERLEKVHRAREIADKVEYTDKDYRSDLVKTYTRTAIDFIKLYAVPVTIAAVSITSILAGHNILNKRNAALGAAYQSLSAAFAEYRNRVVADAGIEKDEAYMTGSKFVETTVDDEGRRETIFETDSNKTTTSPYARVFDEHNECWTKDPIKNRCFIIGQQNYLNDLLHTRGHVFLNEAYEALGFPHTSAGAICGWVLSKDGSTDNYIDFGITNVHDRNAVWLFENDTERSVWLDFNVDGPIYNLI